MPYCGENKLLITFLISFCVCIIMAENEYLPGHYVFKSSKKGFRRSARTLTKKVNHN